MMEELVEGDKVIVYAVERFARRLKDLLSLAEEIDKKKCFLIIPEMDIWSPSTIPWSLAFDDDDIMDIYDKSFTDAIKNHLSNLINYYNNNLAIL